VKAGLGTCPPEETVGPEEDTDREEEPLSTETHRETRPYRRTAPPPGDEPDALHMGVSWRLLTQVYEGREGSRSSAPGCSGESAATFGDMVCGGAGKSRP